MEFWWKLSSLSSISKSYYSCMLSKLPIKNSFCSDEFSSFLFFSFYFYSVLSLTLLTHSYSNLLTGDSNFFISDLIKLAWMNFRFLYIVISFYWEAVDDFLNLLDMPELNISSSIFLSFYADLSFDVYCKFYKNSFGSLFIMLY